MNDITLALYPYRSELARIESDVLIDWDLHLEGACAHWAPGACEFH